MSKIYSATNSSNPLVSIEQKLSDFPVVTSVVNVVVLVAKLALTKVDQKTINKSHILSHIQDKSAMRCLTLTVPVFGQLLVWIFDKVQQYRANKFYQKAQHESNEKNEIQYLTKAVAINNHPEAAEALYKKAYAQTDAKLFLAAAEAGHIKAMYEVGMSFKTAEDDKDKKDPSKDYEQAFKWLHKAAVAGHVDAMYQVAMMYDKRQIDDASVSGSQEVLYVELDSAKDVFATKAFKWCKRAAEAAEKEKKAYVSDDERQPIHTEAMYQLSKMYGEGNGVKENKTFAAKWLKEAADKGHQEAQADREKYGTKNKPAGTGFKNIGAAPVSIAGSQGSNKKGPARSYGVGLLDIGIATGDHK